jgi:hypothetical protein
MLLDDPKEIMKNPTHRILNKIDDKNDCLSMELNDETINIQK